MSTDLKALQDPQETEDQWSLAYLNEGKVQTLQKKLPAEPKGGFSLDSCYPKTSALGDSIPIVKGSKGVSISKNGLYVYSVVLGCKKIGILIHI